MIGFCVLFSFGVAYIAYRGVTGTTGVNVAINVIQIAALLIFSVIAIGYRLNHHDGTPGYTLDPDGNAINVVLAVDKDGKPIKDEKTGAVQGRAGERQGQAASCSTTTPPASPRSRSTRTSPTARSRTPSSTTPRPCR